MLLKPVQAITTPKSTNHNLLDPSKIEKLEDNFIITALKRILVLSLLIIAFIIITTSTVLASENYQLVAKWGMPGDGDGQFNDPWDIDVDKDGNVYVADSLNNRIQKFDSNGNLLMKFGSKGAGDGQFNFLSAVAVDGGGNIYAADTGNQRIEKFAPDGTFLTKWGSYGTGAGQFIGFGGIEVDDYGRVYVADYHNSRIQVFDSTGKIMWQCGSEGTGDGQFNTVSRIAVHKSGNVFATDNGNHRVQKFYRSLSFAAKWGTNGEGEGQFAYPVGIAVDKYSNVYVADSENHRVQKFDSFGSFKTMWGTQGDGDGQFSRPVGIAVDNDGNVYVVDSANNCVQKFVNNASGSSWIKKAPMTVPRIAANSAVVNGKIWVFGGATANYPIPPNNATLTVEMYDPVTDSWTSKPPLPGIQFIAGDAVIGNIVYLYGGAGDSNNIIAYNTETGESENVGTPNNPRFRFDSDVINGKIYSAGQYAPIEEYDPATKKCTDKLWLPETLYWPTVIAVNQKLYIIGGFKQISENPYSVPVNKCYEYDPATNTIIEKSPIPIARGGKQAFVKNGKIYLVGGMVTPGAPPIGTINDIQIYDPQTDSWSISSLPVPAERWGAVVEVVGDNIFMIGGSDNSDAINLNEMLSLLPPDAMVPTTTINSSGNLGKNGWYKSDVVVNLTAEDNEGGSGVDKTEYSFDGGLNWSTYTDSFTVSIEGTTTVSYRSIDKAGNIEDTKTQEIRIDKTAPVIAINAPMAEKEYLLNQSIPSDWSATDAISDIDSATGAVLSGQAINTSSIGTKTFIVTATDKAGNQTQITVIYYIRYSFGGFLCPLNKDGNSFYKGLPIPIRLTLKDTDGSTITNATAKVYVAQVVNGEFLQESPARPLFMPISGNTCIYSKLLRQYVYDLNTASLAKGTWRIRVDLGDGSSKCVNVVIK